MRCKIHSLFAIHDRPFRNEFRFIERLRKDTRFYLQKPCFSGPEAVAGLQIQKPPSDVFVSNGGMILYWGPNGAKANSLLFTFPQKRRIYCIFKSFLTFFRGQSKNELFPLFCNRLFRVISYINQSKTSCFYGIRLSGLLRCQYREYPMDSALWSADSSG